MKNGEYVKFLFLYISLKDCNFDTLRDVKLVFLNGAVVIGCAQSQNFKFCVIDLSSLCMRGSERMKGGKRIGDFKLEWSQAVKRLLAISKCTEFFGWMKRFGYALSLFRCP